MPKPFLTYEQQLVKLRDEKCIVIENESMTLSKLQQVGYYSLVSGYKHLFRIPTQKTYKGGTTFREIVALYEFDESLRELFLHYLLHIERHIRSLLSYYFTEKYGESQSAYLTKTNYNYARKHQQGIDGDNPIRLSAITAGGSQAVFFKINTIGEESFLDDVKNLLEEILEE